MELNTYLDGDQVAAAVKSGGFRGILDAMIAQSPGVATDAAASSLVRSAAKGGLAVKVGELVRIYQSGNGIPHADAVSQAEAMAEAADAYASAVRSVVGWIVASPGEVVMGDNGALKRTFPPASPATT